MECEERLASAAEPMEVACAEASCADAGAIYAPAAVACWAEMTAQEELWYSHAGSRLADTRLADAHRVQPMAVVSMPGSAVQGAVDRVWADLKASDAAYVAVARTRASVAAGPHKRRLQHAVAPIATSCSPAADPRIGSPTSPLKRLRLHDGRTHAMADVACRYDR